MYAPRFILAIRASSVWSPDSRWIEVSYAPNGSVLRELLVVAADGSSSRLLTRHIQRPWGTNYGPISWRPRGATPARLGGPPVAPLPSETVTRTVLHVYGRHSGEIVDSTLWRLGGRARCGSTPGRSYASRSCTVVARADGQLLVLAVEGARIAARTDHGVRLLSIAGKVLRDFPVAASAAALSGAHLALRTASAVEVYDTGTGRLTSRLPVPKAVTLADPDGDILVTTSGETVTLRRLGDGRTTTIRTRGAAHAQLEAIGLYVTGAHRVTFTRMRDVLRRLGS
jgi:hypothetical protein